MAIRNIRTDGDEILLKKSREIKEINDKIKELAYDMIDTMYKFDGIGLAGVQIGVLKRIFVYDISYIEKNGKEQPIVVINPKITKYSKKQITTDEGCLSYPDIFGYVDRSEKVTMEGTDLDGNKIVIKAQGLEAVVLQHEYDHLDGIVFKDKAYDVVLGERKKD